ncbi:HAD family acid phosphatase [Mycoplasmopsis felis]|uniref:HAD family acid phosphatase n=1 Tax=Mycoplasmopsis felis TaxID=33923 RepID=UPI002AFE8FE6|nr:HAD family acid phosphatase [Mycoplasmopsis felis]WQQ10292.1 HAD family acid phosphatase [Mycoplasmopsis felis]
MKLKKLLLSLTTIGSIIPVATAVSCKDETKPEQPTTPQKETLDKNQVILDSVRYLANIWNTVSAEKDAMSYTLYNSAKKQFDTLVKGQPEVFETDKVKVDANGNVTISNTTEGKAIPVVFMDIDETVLNNYSFQNWLVKNHKYFNSSIWNEFVQDKQARKIAGALEFIDYVWKNGGVVMYNSNREQENQLVPTRDNLVSEGLNANYLADWTFWMQGVNLDNAKPWTTIKKDSSNKRVKSEKEDRMNLVNSKKWDLTTEGKTFGNSVALKTVMRVGDNFDDFNDVSSAHKINKERNKTLNDIKQLFGNFDTSVKGVKYTKNADGSVTKENETWAESYVLIGGNASYGGWESGLAKGFYGLSTEDKIKAMDKAIEEFIWKPSKPQS